MDAILAASWLAGQILSLVALCVGLVLSVLYWGLRDAVPPFVPEQKDEEIEHDRRPDEIIAVTRGPAPAMPIGVIQVVRASEDEGEEAKRRFMHFPPTQGPRPAASP